MFAQSAHHVESRASFFLAIIIIHRSKQYLLLLATRKKVYKLTYFERNQIGFSNSTPFCTNNVQQVFLSLDFALKFIDAHHGWYVSQSHFLHVIKYSKLFHVTATIDKSLVFPLSLLSQGAFVPLFTPFLSGMQGLQA